MLRIFSKPTELPLRSVNLSGATNDVAVVPILTSTGDRDLTFERPDGGTNVAFRRRRPSVELRLNLIDRATYAGLMELVGTSYRSTEQQLVGLGIGVGRTTELFAPLGRSTRALSINPATRALDVVDPSSSDHDSIRYAVTREGLLEEIAAGVPRFEPMGALSGLRSELVPTNLRSPSHPSASRIYSAGSRCNDGVFDTSLPSPVIGRTGVERITPTSVTGAVQWFTVSTSSSIASGTYLGVGQWMRGDQAVRVGVNYNGGTYTFADPVQLEPDRWMYVWTDYITGGAGPGAVAILNSVDNPTGDFEVYHGPLGIYQFGSVTGRGPHSWTERATGTTGKDRVAFDARVSSSFSLSCVTRVPTTNAFLPASNMTILDFENAAADTRVRFDTSGVAFRMAGVDYTPALFPTAIQTLYPDRECHVCVTVDRANDIVRTDVAVLRDDGTLARTSSTSALTSSTGTLEDVTRINVGHENSTASSFTTAPIRDVLLDRKPYSETEVERLQEAALAPEWQSFRLATEGRLFRVVDVVLEPIPSRWQSYTGTVTLEACDELDEGSLSFSR